jgi:hypothetical protein
MPIDVMVVGWSTRFRHTHRLSLVQQLVELERTDKMRRDRAQHPYFVVPVSGAWLMA